MGYVAHHALIVSIPDYALKGEQGVPKTPDIEAYRQSLPKEFQRLLIGPVQSVVNGDWTVVFLPDGSKEGWDVSDEGNRIRAELAEMFSWTFSEDEGDPFSPYQVVEVRFGGDDPELGYAIDPRNK